MGRLVKAIPSPAAPTFSTDNFQRACDHVAARDKDLKAILQTYDYPPMWTRPNTFESLIHIILEQQVSLASALAALNKLRDRLGKITPASLLALTDEELKACYFSRQKTVYARHLAEAIESKQFNLKTLENLSDDVVREKIVALKGLGNWSADIYLMFVLQRADLFPPGDLAAVNALKAIKKLPKDVSKEKLATITARWAPYRTVATMILWHYYLSIRTNKTSAKEKIEKAIVM
jgi:DNA-3-methyladenine glycosylase II